MKPILFNTEMVRAILDGRKTVTRRVVKPQPGVDGLKFCYASSKKSDINKWIGCGRRWVPPYRPGDILYVRETWAPVEGGGYIYRAGFQSDLPFWRPSIHMPREAARLFLRVTDVRVERLQDITETQILEVEGVRVDFPEPKPTYFSLAYAETRLKPAIRKVFADLWNSTIKPKDRALYGWEVNPWVWVIEFERCEKPEEDMDNG